MGKAKGARASLGFFVPDKPQYMCSIIRSKEAKQRKKETIVSFDKLTNEIPEKNNHRFKTIRKQLLDCYVILMIAQRC